MTVSNVLVPLTLTLSRKGREDCCRLQPQICFDGFDYKVIPFNPSLVKATGSVRCDLLHRGHGTKALRLDRENGIELAAKVLERDDRG